MIFVHLVISYSKHIRSLFIVKVISFTNQERSDNIPEQDLSKD